MEIEDKIMKKGLFVFVFFLASVMPAQAFTVDDSRPYALLESLMYETRAEVLVCVRSYPRNPADKDKIREQCFKFSKEAVCGGELDDYLVWPDLTESESPAQVEPVVSPPQ